MGKKDFDNLGKVYTGKITTLADVLQSAEIDLDLPRGFLAKIYKVIFGYDTLSGVGVNTARVALHRDPDDQTWNQIPPHAVQNDAICDHIFRASSGTLTTGNYENTDNHFQVDFPEHVDIITARNLRFNAEGSLASPTFGEVTCDVFYTLEAVNDAKILDIMEIL